METKYGQTDVWTDPSINNLQNLLISNPKPDLHNYSVHTKFGEHPFIFTEVTVRK